MISFFVFFSKNTIDVIEYPVEALAATPKHHLTGNHVLKFILVETNLNLLRLVGICTLCIEQIDIIIGLYLHHEFVNLMVEHIIPILSYCLLFVPDQIAIFTKSYCLF